MFRFSQFSRHARWPLMLLLALATSLVMADPPARVGRLAHLENQVSFRVDRSTERGAATINWPISSGAILDTDWRGRAEVWIGSSAFRLAGNSELEFVQVDDQQINLKVSVGSLAISIMDNDQLNELSVTTPEGIVRFSAPGRYRIDVLSDHSEVTAQAGQLVVDDRNRAITVLAGHKARLYQDQPPRVDNDFDQDNFDFWVAERENATMANSTRRYVSPQMTGYQDLDANGDWRPESEYGSVWYPRTVAADWAPYRFGRWAWVAPWGWTWIDQAPWGFAPFHYGRWVNIHNRWGWVPGNHLARPVYAPALVGWIGNPGWSINFSFGSAPAVGWFPLAPREVYVPAYRHSQTYIRQINITHVRDVKMIDRAARPGARENFSHRDRQQAVTVVPANLMREGRPISSRELRRPERHELERAPQARQAPSKEWLAPAASASRPSPDERREPSNGRPRRDGDHPSRTIPGDRPAPRQAPATGPSPPPDVRQALPATNPERRNDAQRGEPPRNDMAPDIRRDDKQFQNRERRPSESIVTPQPMREPAPQMRPSEPVAPIAPPRPESGSQRRETPSVVPQTAPLPAVPPSATPPSAVPSSAVTPTNPARENRREIREGQGIERSAPRENSPPASPQREPLPAASGMRAPAAQPPASQPPPVTPGPEREPRREMREAPRMERMTPRDTEAVLNRQREVAPQAAPVIRAPQSAPPQPQAMPQPQAPRQPQAMPQPTREMPRQESRPVSRPDSRPESRPDSRPEARQENRGGDKAQRQERNNDKGERGQH